MTTLQKGELAIGQYEFDDIAEALKVALIYGDHDPGIVLTIAKLTGQKKRTIYDWFDGKRKKMKLSFLHACVIASNGDPEARKFLEPEGYQLVMTNAVAPSVNWEKEIGDLDVAVSKLRVTIREAIVDGNINRQKNLEIDRRISEIRTELAEVEELKNRFRSGAELKKVVG